MEAYYYNRLDKAGQNAYHGMLTGIDTMQPSFQVPLLENRVLSDIYFCLRMDHPELFYTVDFKYRYYKDSGNAEMLPEYLFDKKKVQDHRAAMSARVTKVARQIEAEVSSAKGKGAGGGNRGGHGAKGKGSQGGFSAKEQETVAKLQGIHDFLIGAVHYDKLKKPYSHEIIGPLGQGVGVCEGIAKSVKALCDEMGIWCIVALCGNNPEKGIKYRHTWNVVRVGNTYYHLDVTFDLSLSTPDEVRYDYFLLDDGQIFRDHEPLIHPVPACTDHDHFYYKEVKMSFTKLEDVSKRVSQAAKKGKPLTFHWRGGYLTREVLNEILDIFEQEAMKYDRHVRVALNWPQAVIRVTFDKEKPTQQLVMEEANEGERLE